MSLVEFLAAIITQRAKDSAERRLKSNTHTSIGAVFSITRTSAIAERPARCSVSVEMSYCCTNNANRSPVSAWGAL